MFLFAILMFLNATVSNDLLFRFRWDIGGLPINAIDALTVLFLARQLFRSRSEDFQADRMHPLLAWSIALLLTASLFGIFGAITNGIGFRKWVTVLRNLLVLPMAILAGYNLVRSPRYAKPILYVWLIASYLSALSVLFMVRMTAEGVREGSSFDQLRVIAYGGDAGLGAAALLAFAFVARVRLIRWWWLSLGLFLTAAVGYFSIPHRGNYLLGALTLLFATIILPKVSWGRRLGMTTVSMVALAATLFAGVAAMSKFTGRDFGTYVVEKRIKALIPGFEEETHRSLTDTRMSGIIAELHLWQKSPLIGSGFAIGERYADYSEASLNHNVWTSALAQYGIVGFLAFFVPVVGSILVGYRMWRDQTEPYLSVIGALAAIVGVTAFLWASITMSINTQRPALWVGLMFGIVFRCRAIQLTLARQSAGDLQYGLPERTAYLPDEYADFPVNSEHV